MRRQCGRGRRERCLGAAAARCRLRRATRRRHCCADSGRRRSGVDARWRCGGERGRASRRRRGAARRRGRGRERPPVSGHASLCALTPARTGRAGNGSARQPTCVGQAAVPTCAAARDASSAPRRGVVRRRAASGAPHRRVDDVEQRRYLRMRTRCGGSRLRLRTSRGCNIGGSTKVTNRRDICERATDRDVRS